MIFRAGRTGGHAADDDIPPGYAVADVLGESADAITYRATEDRLHRGVALRILRAAAVDVDARRRCEETRRALGALPAHPHIATLYEAGFTPGGRLFVALGFYPGGSARHRLRETGPFPVHEVTAIGGRLAGALVAAHASGVVHGGIDPGDILLTGAGEPVLAGFGLAAAGRSDDWRARAEPAAIVHLAPEVLEGGLATPASDLYGLAATLYTLLAGSPAYEAAAEGGLAALIQRVLRDEVPGVSRADVPKQVEDVLRVAMAADPGRRFASAAALAAALAGAAEPERSALVGAPPAPALPVPAEQAPPAAQPTDADRQSVPAARPVDAEAQRVPVRPAPSVPAAPTGDGASDDGTTTVRGAPWAHPPGSEGETAADGERRPAGHPRRHAMLVAVVTLTVIAVALGIRMGTSSKGEATAAAATGTPTARPTVVDTPAPASKLEQSRYQPQSLQAMPAPRQVVVSWLLPPDAQQDGAGIIIRQEPAPQTGVIALSRTNGRLPQTYVLSGAQSGQQYCFIVGVLLQRTGGEPLLVPAGPVCTVAR
jgi:hypothetical protein